MILFYCFHFHHCFPSCSCSLYTGLFYSKLLDLLIKTLDLWNEIEIIECFHLTKWHQYIFSASLKFGACYIAGQCGYFLKKCYWILLCTLMAFFFVFHHKICVFIIFISFSDKLSNFFNRILTNRWIGGFKMSAELFV